MSTLYSINLINFDAVPSLIPACWTVEEHKPGGLIKNISLYLSKKQKKGFIKGYNLRIELTDKLALNANVLDYLLTHRESIPDEWKGKAIFFWGTIYSGWFTLLYVRCLYWSGSMWRWGYRCLGSSFDSDEPAALAS